MLLMFQAHEKRIVAPNKPEGSAIGKLSRDGPILESETYDGGHLESLRTGIYRSDLPVIFELDPTALDDLESSLDAMPREDSPHHRLSKSAHLNALRKLSLMLSSTSPR
jgi:hypothetical protein